MADHHSPAYGAVRDELDLKPESYVPLYEQLKSQLRAVTERLEPDVLMPSERELMELAGVGRATVRKAVSDLVFEGLLYSKQGRGTFTSPRRVESELRGLTGFTETMVGLGRAPSTDILAVRLEPASPQAAEGLGIPPQSDVYVVERLRKIDYQPAMLEKCHLAAALCPGLIDHDLSGSLYRVLEDSYGLRAVRGVESVAAINADARIARILDVPVASAVLATIRRTHAQDGAGVEFTLRHARGDLCSFRVGLSDESWIASMDGSREQLADLTA